MIPLLLNASVILLCAGKPSMGAQPDGKHFAVLKLPATEAVLQMLRTDPPVARMTFAGESGPLNEWIARLKDDPQTGLPVIVRFTKSGDPLQPLQFKAGTLEVRDNVNVFSPSAGGTCGLSEVAATSEGPQK